MCAQCAIIAAAGASGARVWLAGRPWRWLTPSRLRLATAVLIIAALAASSIAFA